MVSGKYPQLTVPGGGRGRKGKGKGKRAKYSIPSSSTPSISYTSRSAASVGQQSNLATIPSAPFRLQDLPNELLQRVLTFVFCGHDPDEVVGISRTDQALLCLGATSHHIREQIEIFGRLTLGQIGEPTTHVNMAEAALQQQRPSPRLLGYTTALFHFKDKCCVFCGRASTRQSSMMSTMRTCRGCEKGEWGIITRSTARTQFDLTDAQLNPEGPSALPVVRRGSDGSKGFQAPATIYLYDDVVKLATAVHGDWEEHMRKKAAKSKARQEARDARRLEREADIARRFALFQQHTMARRMLQPYPYPYHPVRVLVTDDIPSSGIPAEDSGLDESDDDVSTDTTSFPFQIQDRFGIGSSNNDNVVVQDRGAESYPSPDSDPRGLDFLAQAALGAGIGGTDANYDFDVAPGSNTGDALMTERPASRLPAPQPRDRNERFLNTFHTSAEIMRPEDIDTSLTDFDGSTYIGTVAPNNTPYNGPVASSNNNTQAVSRLSNVSLYFEHNNTATDQNNFNTNTVAATPDEDHEMDLDEPEDQSGATNNEYGYPYGYPMPGHGFPPLPPFYPTDEL